MIFGINTTCDISKLSQMAREITYNSLEISLVVFMPNITTNYAITYRYSNLPGLKFFVYCIWIIICHSHLNDMEILKTKRFIPKEFELGTTLS